MHWLIVCLLVKLVSILAVPWLLYSIYNFLYRNIIWKFLIFFNRNYHNFNGKLWTTISSARLVSFTSIQTYTHFLLVDQSRATLSHTCASSNFTEQLMDTYECIRSVHIIKIGIQTLAVCSMECYSVCFVMEHVYMDNDHPAERITKCGTLGMSKTTKKCSINERISTLLTKVNRKYSLNSKAFVWNSTYSYSYKCMQSMYVYS